VANVQNLNRIVARPIENLVGVANDKRDPHLGIVGSIPAIRLICELRDGFANARCNIPRPTSGALY
jgi:hypothetical protein